MPTELDVLHARIKTTGIIEPEYDVGQQHVFVYHMGGQRNERRKWPYCFEGSPAVLFVVAVSEFNQMLYKDETQNCMTEALDLFGEIVNSRWFQYSAIVLLLNKADLLQEKLAAGFDPKNLEA